jgi:hypothetical protein
MKRGLRTVAIFLAAMIATVIDVRAAVYPGEWFVWGGGGGLFGTEKVDLNTLDAPSHTDKIENRALVEAAILYHFTQHFGLGFEYMRPTGQSVTSSMPQNEKFGEEFFLLTARYVFLPERSWNHYLAGGAGAARVSGRDLVLDNCGGNCGPRSVPVKFSASLPAGLLGFGTQYSFNDYLLIGMELGVVARTKRNQDANIHSAVLPYISGMLGFDFGGRGRP